MKDDTIYRKAAIDALCDNCSNVQAVCAHYPCKQYIAVEKLPSAQPEIIRCKDCIYCDTTKCAGECHPCYLRSERGIPVLDEDFCSWAERKEIQE